MRREIDITNSHLFIYRTNKAQESQHVPMGDSAKDQGYKLDPEEVGRIRLSEDEMKNFEESLYEVEQVFIETLEAMIDDREKFIEEELNVDRDIIKKYRAETGRAEPAISP